MVQRRKYLERLDPFIDKPIIKVLTGIRRCGKSTLLRSVEQKLLEKGVDSEQILFVNFESAAFRDLLKAEELVSMVQKFQKKQRHKTYLFFDEIQQVEGWEKAVNSFRVDYACDLYITGSNATLLSGRLATHLAGRYIRLEVQPFSFSEFAELYSPLKKPREELFASYLKIGGMPFLQYFDLEISPSQIYLMDVYTTVVLQDIVAANQLRDVDLLDRLIRYALQEIGNPFSANSIVRFLKSENRRTSVDTVLNYLRACEEAFLLTKVDRVDLQGKQRLRVGEKYYAADHGFREALVGGNQQQIQAVLENIVFRELLSRGFTVQVGQNKKREVDFVAQRGDERLYIQVSYLLASPETEEREFSAFEGIFDHYPKLLLSLDPVDRSRHGIIHRNLMDFLMEN